MKPILLPTFGAGSLAFFVKFQPMPEATYPANLFRRHSRHQREIRYIFGYHCSCANHAKSPKCNPTQNGGIGADARALLYQCGTKLVLAFYKTAWIDDIGEHHTRPQKDIVLAGHARVEGDVVLHFHIVSKHYTICHEHILPEYAVLTNHTLCGKVAKMPDTGVVADLGAGVNDGGWVCVVGHA